MRNYKEEVKSIQHKLSKYEPKRVFELTLYALEKAPFKVTHETVVMPTISFLLIKWALLFCREGKRIITQKELNDLVLDILELQELAKGNHSIPFELQTRTLLIQQLAWQNDDREEVRALVRQAKWFASDPNDFFSTSFHKLYGYPIESYFKIATYFASIGFERTGDELPGEDLGKILLYLSPTIPQEHITAFIKMMACDWHGLTRIAQENTIAGSPEWEYFIETPFIDKPLLIQGWDIILLNSKLAVRAFSQAIPRLLKLHEAREFKSHFGKKFEDYIERLFSHNKIQVITEAKIKDLYKAHRLKGKVVDFLLADGAHTFIDAKAIEPNDFINTCTNPQELRSRLEESYIKAIWQCQECCHRLSSAGTSSLTNYALIVVHQEHYFGTGTDIEQQLHPALSSEIKDNYGAIPIPLSNVFYATIADLERILAISELSQVKVSEILSEAVRNDQSHSSGMSTIHQYLRNRDDYSEHPLIKDNTMNYINELAICARENASYWGGRTEEFVVCRAKMAIAIHG